MMDSNIFFEDNEKVVKQIFMGVWRSKIDDNYLARFDNYPLTIENSRFGLHIRPGWG